MDDGWQWTMVGNENGGHWKMVDNGKWWMMDNGGQWKMGDIRHSGQ